MNDVSSASAASLDESVARTAKSYDDEPYQAIPFARLDPARLNAVARLFGVSAAPAASARVLEIGCATGGHLIPLAAARPHARFVEIGRAHV